MKVRPGYKINEGDVRGKLFPADVTSCAPRAKPNVTETSTATYVSRELRRMMGGVTSDVVTGASTSNGSIQWKITHEVN